LTTQAFAVGAVVGLLAAVSAAVMPALRLARKSPVAALTMRGREMPQALLARWGGRPLLLVVIVVLIAAQQLTQTTAIGLVTTTLIALAACVFAAPLAAAWGAILKRLWERLFGPTGRFAAGYLARQPRRTALIVATLGVGLGSVLLLGMLAWSFERTLVTTLSRSLRAELAVFSSFVSRGYRPAPMAAAILSDLRVISGVAAVAGEQSQDSKYGMAAVVLKSFDAIAFSDERIYRWPLERGAVPDALAKVAAGDAIIVTTSFAHQHATSVGDRVQLRSPTGPVDFEVAAITTGQPENAVILSRDKYRAHWNDGMIYIAHVALDPGSDAAAMETTIARMLGQKYRVAVRTRDELIGYFARQVREGFQIQYVGEVVTLLLVLIGIGDTLATSVMERTREFGMMRAVGLHRSRLVAILLLEGAGIALLGLFLAAITGLALGAFWVEVQWPALLGWKLDLSFPIGFAASAAALTFLLCLVGSVLPAWRAARLSVPEALRNE
jgi:putative ABC transport system permease protein